MPGSGIGTESGIYAIVHVPSGKLYVGSAVIFRRRWFMHRSLLKKGRHVNRYLQAAWDKYGASQFVFMPLETVAEREDLIRVEQEYLDRIRPFDRRVGYNLSPTAGSSLGCKLPAETRAKLSAIQKGKKVTPFTPEHCARISAAKKGKTLSAEHRAKLGEVRKGRKHSPETRAKIAESGRKRVGKPHSAESRAKMSLARRGRKLSAEHRANLSKSRKNLSPETRAKVSEANRRRKGEKRSDEVRAKLSAAHKGKPVSAEARAKISAAQKGRKLSAEHRAKLSASAKNRGRRNKCLLVQGFLAFGS